MTEAFNRRIIVYGTHFWNFYNSRNEKMQEKVDWVIGLIKTVPSIPEKFFKHLDGTKGLYEIRVRAGSDIIRLLCCLDEGSTIVLLNAFQKKSEKTPKQEIRKALKLKRQYYEDKKDL